MEYLSERIARYFFKHHLLNADDIEVCQYAIYRRLSRIVVGGLLVLLGRFEAGLFPAICFTLAFLFLREATGGYHAPNEVTCVILSCVVEFVLLMLVDPLLRLQPSQWLLMVGGCAFIVLIAPVNDENIHMTDQEMKINACRARLRLAIIVSSIVILQLLGAVHAVVALQLAIFGVATSILVATLKNI